MNIIIGFVAVIALIILGGIIIIAPFYLLEEKSTHDKSVGILRLSYGWAIGGTLLLGITDISLPKIIGRIVGFTLAIYIVAYSINDMAENKIKEGEQTYYNIIKQLEDLQQKEELTEYEQKRIKHHESYIRKNEKYYKKENYYL